MRLRFSPVRVVRAVRVALLALVPLVGGACGHHADAPEGTLVVGVQAEDYGALVGPVHMVTRVDGAVFDDQTVTIGPSAPPPGGLPKEIPVHGAPNAQVDVLVEGFAPGAAPGAAKPVVSRAASSHLVADGTKKLLRVVLEQRCAELPGAPPLSCGAGLTCVAGTCASGYVAVDQLEDYDPAWPAAPPDICRPAKHGPPEVSVGTGMTDFAPLVDGQVLQMELGPQGGHHIWIAARQKNLRRSGSTTMITAKLVDTPDAPVPPAAFVFTFDPDEGSYCKLWGLRYQFDSGAQDLLNDYKRFLGKKVAVTVTITDSTKASASATKVIQLADQLLCPDGTNSCNVP